MYRLGLYRSYDIGDEKSISEQTNHKEDTELDLQNSAPGNTEQVLCEKSQPERITFTQHLLFTVILCITTCHSQKHIHYSYNTNVNMSP